MATLLIDNYDSYTFNLYQLLARVEGEEPVVVRNDEVAWSVLAAEGWDRIVVSPGPGRPERARDLGVCAGALAQDEIAVLGVCLGHQGLAFAEGGHVAEADEPVHGRVSRIFHDGAGEALAVQRQPADPPLVHEPGVDGGERRVRRAAGRRLPSSRARAPRQRSVAHAHAAHRQP